MFTTFTKIICRVEEGDPAELKKEILTQLEDDWDDDDENITPEEMFPEK